MTQVMKAIVIERPGGPEVLELRQDWPKPKPEEGMVLIRVMAFGLNRGEVYTRLGHSPTVTFPRVLGIECAGVVEAAPGTELEKGQIVVATTGGMGREYDGSYAEFVLVPATHVHAVETTLDWAELAAVPEVFHTAWGGLHPALGIQPEEILLIRGGSSSVGLVAANIAKKAGLTVLSTTRKLGKRDLLESFDVDCVVIDRGEIAPTVRQIISEGVDRMFDLVGTNVLDDSFACVKTGGTLCIAGLLGGEWEIKNFVPGSTVPSTTKFTYFSSSATPLPTEVLQDYLRDLEAGVYRMPLDRVFPFEEIQAAHSYMEANTAEGKVVVRLT